MSQQPPDEEFERRLRDVFRSRGLGVPVPPDALDRIHSGARRRQQRRTATGVTAAFLVVAITGIGVGIRNIEHHGGDDQIAAGSHTPVSSPLPSPVNTASVGVTFPGVASSAATLPTPPSSALATPTFSPAAPTHYPSPGSAVPADFIPSSVTAVNAKTFWVLGTQQCGQQSCTAVVRTTDGGAHFTEIAAPHAATISIDNSTRVVYNLRFADNDDGWAYGEALWTTSDGGTTWSDTSLPAGAVKDLAAAREPGATTGTVWATVQPTPYTSGYQLWRALYSSGGGTGTWQRVDLGSDPPAEEISALVVQGGTAYLLATDAKKLTHLYVSTASGTTVQDPPCIPFDTELSGGIGSLWTTCSSGSAGDGPRAAVSTDGGATWKNVAPLPAITAGIIGGIDPTAAVIDEGSGLRRITTSGQSHLVSTPQQTNGYTFIGFTDATTGYAIGQPDPARLWRTTDGGLTWKTVRF